MSSLVTVRYGPYESCGVVNHKTFRLEGLQAVLRDCGYVCVLEEAPDWNQVEMVVHGESVYKCDINKLEFGGDGRLDPLCQEAIEAVRNAYQQHQI
ncbi:hypothetical protein KOW79_002442 [Hemibagrus wyckioides]|uniref:Uncharacterized protein n=1 Tax=Hemibagrus wyckioides TaxID=337641 RepID=A0A9D3P6L9_9TELE|nr:UPF0728 protein C10orf53 homolog [Hemibagrus wyckioides]KAG7334035.1 hypothetical protein KOW79_002442 [Hemibagrus wyckioides]